MEVHQLVYLVAVAEEASFSRAAERVGVTSRIGFALRFLLRLVLRDVLRDLRIG